IQACFDGSGQAVGLPEVSKWYDWPYHFQVPTRRRLRLNGVYFMRWNDLSIRKRTIGGSAIVVLLMLSVGFITYRGTSQVQATYKQAVENEYNQSLNILQLQLAAAKQQYLISKAISFGTKDDIKKCEQV